ncbi:TetR/AcrR family transcriptional regulator [uncultured Sphingomonas sp.]|uniref:TetR/AcrR family transcriptional regulator n=1 Tax=uncultured Sphingomonas sp. TaxID=158754 RepID=UPI0035CA0AFE
MVRKRTDMIAETRAKLIAAARREFAAKGYADSAMEDLTAEAGLTRGALYHHFGGKPGLLAAVIAQIDDEMTERLNAIADRAETRWRGFLDELEAYMEMSLEPEIQRIVLLDGPAVLGDPSRWPSQMACIRTTKRSLELMVEEGTIRPIDVDATARLVSGAALGGTLWIAGADDPKEASKQVVRSLTLLVSGLLSQPE